MKTGSRCGQLNILDLIICPGSGQQKSQVLVGMHFVTAKAQGSISTSLGCFADLFFLEHTQHNEPGPMQSFVAIAVWAAWGLMALLVAMFPANVSAARRGVKLRGRPVSPLWIRGDHSSRINSSDESARSRLPDVQVGRVAALVPLRALVASSLQRPATNR